MPLRVVIGTLLLLGLAATGTLAASKGKAAASQPGKVGTIDRSHAGTPAPAIAFEAAGGKVFHVAEFRGKAVLVNLWATWCVPCRAEMPALDALAAKQGPALTILPISADLEGWRAVTKFFTPGKFAHLTPYLDQPGNYPVAMGATGLPLSILYGPDGRERWRVNGPLKWASPEVVAAVG